jgi:hypothetical protein
MSSDDVSALGQRTAETRGGDAKADGETWEAYAHRLEKRIKEQRDQLLALSELRDGPQRLHRKRIAHLERLLGQKEAQLAQQHDGLAALKAALRDGEVARS